MKNVLSLIVWFASVFSVVGVMAEEKLRIESNDSAEVVITESEDLPTSDLIVLYYLHMNRRCMTCGKLETYSKEAIETGFAEQLKDSSIVFRVENFEQEGNEHFAKKYQLYSQSLIISRQHNGKETEWKSLDKIWQLVGSQEEFIAYVQTEVASFLEPIEDE